MRAVLAFSSIRRTLCLGHVFQVSSLHPSRRANRHPCAKGISPILIAAQRKFADSIVGANFTYLSVESGNSTVIHRRGRPGWLLATTAKYWLATNVG
jgi:hypothetical protein